MLQPPARLLRLRQLCLVRRRHHASLAHAQLLLGEEAERPQLTHRPDLAPVPSHARPDRLHSTTEGLTVRRLDDQVSMVALQ